MQKKIIALAVAGLVSGVAFAQTNVTVYGVIDQSYTYSKSNAATGSNKFSGIKDGGMSGSRFGFKGEEALGNGLKAIFTMEYGKSSDNDINQVNANSDAFYIRQAFVGLSNQYGTLTLGRQYNAASDVYGPNSSNGVVNAMPVDAFQGQNGSQIRSQGGSARQDNMIKYVSPDMSGFRVRADYAFGENASNTNITGATANTAGTSDNGRYSIAGSYANGPFGVDLAYAGQSNVYTNYNSKVTSVKDIYGVAQYDSIAAGRAGQGKGINEWYLGGRYDFKVVKLYGSYQQMKNNTDVQDYVTDDGKATSVNTGSKMWQVGLSAPVGANGLAMLEYSEIRFEADNYVNTGTAAKPSVRNDGKNKGFGIGYAHNLSKRTTLYAFASQLKYDTNTGSTGDWLGSSGKSIAVAGEKTNTFSAGIRHMF